MDVGRTPTSHEKIDIPQHRVASYHDNITGDLTTLPRTEYIQKISSSAIPRVADFYRSGLLHGVIGLGGSSGTALVTSVMRNALPVGVPKLMVSTMASGDVKIYVDETDITMMYSVVDVAGLNPILKRIVSNAAAAITGMAVTFAATATATASIGPFDNTTAKRVAVTMFGVTTPCVDRIREHLSRKYGYEVYVFHATGSGGKAMERLISEGQIDAVLDLTTTEVADHIVGGLLSAGPHRLEAAAKAGIPQVISVGACDMVNFGAKSSVPVDFSYDGDGTRTRVLHEHNPSVTLMRTTPDENRQIAEFIASKLLCASRPDLIRVVLPTGGVSMLSTRDEPFHNPEADAMLFDTLQSKLADSRVRVDRHRGHINDEKFAVSVAEMLVELVAMKSRQ